MSNKFLSRRTFNMSMAAVAPAILRASPSTQEGRIKIDTERVIGDIDKKIYGNFTEHLGRCIEGGIFEENSPCRTATGFAKMF